MKPLDMKSCCSLGLSGEEESRLQKMAHALGNPIRFEILKFLLTHPGCITGDIVDVLPIAQSTTSQHLKVLKEAGWIEGNVSGTAVNYCLKNGDIDWFQDALRDLLKK